MPEDTYGIERYLGSGAIRGIGAALAARIVRKFGDDTLRIVEEEPEQLAEVKGISEKKAREIAAQVSEKAEMRKVMIFLSIRSFRRILTDLRKIFPVWDLRLLMRLLPESVFTQTQITESAAECCILFCRLREKDILIFRGNSYLQDVPDFWE